LLFDRLVDSQASDVKTLLKPVDDAARTRVLWLNQPAQGDLVTFSAKKSFNRLPAKKLPWFIFEKAQSELKVL